MTTTSVNRGLRLSHAPGTVNDIFRGNCLRAVVDGCTSGRKRVCAAQEEQCLKIGDGEVATILWIEAQELLKRIMKADARGSVDGCGFRRGTKRTRMCLRGACFHGRYEPGFMSAGSVK